MPHCRAVFDRIAAFFIQFRKHFCKLLAGAFYSCFRLHPPPPFATPPFARSPSIIYLWVCGLGVLKIFPSMGGVCFHRNRTGSAASDACSRAQGHDSDDTAAQGLTSPAFAWDCSCPAAATPCGDGQSVPVSRIVRIDHADMPCTRLSYSSMQPSCRMPLPRA